MKYLIAFIPPEALARVKQSLISKHIHGMTVSGAEGFGQEHDVSHPEYREFVGLELKKKARIEIACHDEEVEQVLKAIYLGSHTGRSGDGKVFILPILDAMRLTTGERGPAALGPPFDLGDSEP